MSFESLARECGLNFEGEHLYDHCGIAPGPSGFPHSDYEMYSDEVDELLDDIENSSPSRGNATRPQSLFNVSQQAPRQIHQSAFMNEEITQYEDEDQFDVGNRQTYPQSQRQPFWRSTAGGPSTSRMSVIDTHTSTTRSNQFVPRELFQRHAAAYRPVRSLAGPSSHVSERVQSSCITPPQHKETQLARRSYSRPGHGVRLRPVSELPDMYRGMFKFGVFNAVQSSCFDTVMHTDENMVISAPTGSGKTVLFELAIIRMLIQSGGGNGTSKCIYVAPTKALCSEKCRDWTTKFQALGIKCCELTGDTVVFGKGAWGDAKNANVIITTSEKWDSLTRHWHDYGRILSQIQLFLIDEVHILNESRGSTLEVVVSRMKTNASSVRFVVVSATVPNIEDVASWIGDGDSGGSATIKHFGEEYRPCKLTKFVHAFPKKKDHNDFVFQRTLDMNMYGILEQHSVNKPVLVFCSTRKGVMTTAEQIMKEYEEAAKKRKTLPWVKPSSVDQTFHNKQLEKLSSCGIGVHHAGMSMDERRATEDLYLRKILKIIFATSTLAVGVNLPAHTVVIKGVKIFQNNTSQEYSDLDIMQMMGRAGRPQFDKEGVAVIMCETELEAKYKALVQGQTLLESCLHRNLSEHINSEIGLGTITDLDSAKKWLHNSFLFQRIQRNPRHYAIRKDGAQSWQERIDEMVTQSITDLQENNLVSQPEGSDNQLTSTEYGDIMSKFYIRQSTMSIMLKLSEKATLKEILETVSNSEELSDIKLRGGEKQIYNKMREHNDIRFQIKKVEKPADKVFMLIQAVLGGLQLNDPAYKNGDNNPTLEAISVFRHVARIAKAVVEVAITKKAGALLRNSLEALRCLTAKAWEDRPVVLRQIEQIGEKSIKVLAEYNITSFDTLRKQDPLRLEALLNRRPPFGHEVLAHVNSLPQYTLSITEVSVTRGGGFKPAEVELSIDVGIAIEEGHSIKSKKVKDRTGDSTVVVTLTSDSDFIDFRRVPTKLLKEATKAFTVTAKLTKPSQSIVVYMASTNIAGVSIYKSYKPALEAKYFPTADTRPPTAIELMLEGFEDDPDFCNMDPDDEDIPMKDLTQPSNDAVKKRGTEKTPLRQAKTVPKSAGASRSALQPRIKRLSNGNYECNHTCKDKAKCRHMCCRDGVEKPPPMSKKRIEAMCTTEESSTQSRKLAEMGSIDDEDVATAKAKQKQKQKQKSQPCDKPDARLQQLDSLHQQTNVKENLKLPAGQRIKLDEKRLADTRDKGKRKAAPNLNLEFSQLGEGRATELDVTELADDSDDDLPDAREILGGYNGSARPDGWKQRQNLLASDPSETNYSNSEIDALIRAVPLAAPDDPIELEDSDDAASVSPSPAYSRKRKHQTEIAPSKRFKVSAADNETLFRCSPSPVTIPQTPRRDVIKGKQKMTEESLFTKFSSDEEYQVKEDVYGEHSRIAPSSRPHSDFTLDPGLINITPATPALTMSTSIRRIDDSTSFGSRLPVSESTSELPQTREDLSSSKWWDEDVDIERANAAYQKELDDLDEWFQSGAVQIIDQVSQED